MTELVYTLLGDGPSDRRLIFPTNWLLSSITQTPFRAQWADTRGLVRLREGLAARVEKALELFPCDLLIVHRDAETQEFAQRFSEIDAAVRESGWTGGRTVRLVPVRMQEAWLLPFESAIRRAAGRPAGRTALKIPRISEIEAVADPKAVLHNLLRTAADVTGRRLHRFDVNAAAFRVAELVEDFSPLRAVPAFSRFEDELRQAVASFPK
jgi:hypothetical protein